MSSVEYLEFGDGELLPIQADDSGVADGSSFAEQPQPVGRLSADGFPGKEKVEESIDRLRRFGALAAERFSDLPRKPDKVTVEIAVKVSASAGVVIAQCATEANFKIAIEWTAGETDPARPASGSAPDA